MKESTEALGEIATDDAEARLAVALAELETLEAKASELERDAESKAKAFEQTPTEAAFAVMKVADQLAKNARKAADDLNAERVYPLRVETTAQVGARRYAELHPQVDIRTMIAPLAVRFGELLSRFSAELDAEVAEFGKALARRNQLVSEANTLARRFGGQPDHFTYQHLTVAQAFAEYVQPEISRRLGAIGFDATNNRGCLLRHVAPGNSNSSIELQLRLDATSLPFRAV